MSEQDQQETRSPLQSDRGVTTVKEGVVSQLAGMAAGEVEGVHMGGGASRSAGGLLDRATGSSGQTRGVSVEVGQTEAAIDLKMGIEYGKNILQTVEDVRRRITDRVEGLTGLRIREINATVSDIVFVDEEEKRERRSAGLQTGAEEEEEVEPREMPTRELRPGAREREVTEVEPRSREHTEAQSGPVPEEDVHVRDTPVKEDETAELEVGEGEVEKRPERSEGGGSVRRIPRGSSGSGGSGSGSSGGDDSGSGGRRGRGGSRRGGRRRRDNGSGDGESGER